MARRFGKMRKIARRTFLVGAVAMAGGVAFGTYAWRREPDNPLLAGLAPGEAALTPHVRIGPDGITLITPRADKGQGAVSIQAMLLAEELDVDPYALHTDFGPPSPAYWNGTVLAEGFPFAATDERLLARGARGVGAVMGKLMGIQITGGSSTVADAFVRLRLAGASARETLKAAAARKTGHAVTDLGTESGAVVLPDGTRLPYPDLVPDLDQTPLVSVAEADLRDPAQWRFLGHAHRRLDIVAKSTGSQTYGIDLRPEGVLHASLRSDPLRRGGGLGFDATAALAMRGVQTVAAIPGGVAVIADNTWRAMQALGAVAIDWPAPPAGAPDQAALWQEIAASFTPDRQDSTLRDDGDVETALAGGLPDVVADYRMPYLAHAAMEPLNATVLLGTDRIDIWTGTQIPRFAQDAVARRLGWDADQVHLHNQMIGGSFGRRLEDDFILHAVEVARLVPGQPVKVTWSREEDFAHDFPRPAAMARGRGRVAGGQVEALDLAIAAQSVTASQVGRLGLPAAGPDVAIVAGAWDQPFAIPHVRVAGYRVPEQVAVSSWRSVGASANGAFHDCFLDELIHAAGADPMAERLRLCSDPLAAKVLEAVAEMSGWQGPRPAPMADGARRGRGVGFCLSFGVPVAVVVDLAETPDGLRIERAFAAAEVGRVLDPVNFEAQMMGGIVFGLGTAMNCEITYAGGLPEQTNFDSFEGMRLRQCPQITVRGLENGSTLRGIGEPPVPAAIAALTNAVFATTGQRLREWPLSRQVTFA